MSNARERDVVLDVINGLLNIRDNFHRNGDDYYFGYVTAMIDHLERNFKVKLDPETRGDVEC